jgi:hypothetical protein
MPKVAKKKVVKSNEPVVTDIKREYFIDEYGVEKVKQTHLNGSKVVKEDIINS